MSLSLQDRGGEGGLTALPYDQKMIGKNRAVQEGLDVKIVAGIGHL